MKKLKNMLRRLVSPLVLALLALSVLISCACRPQEATHGKKINLGKQFAAITLTAGSNNDLNIAPSGGTTTMVRLTPSASNSIISGVNSSQVSDGDIFLFRNDATSGLVSITHNDSNSAVLNRIKTANGATIILGAWGAAWLEWDGVQNTWIASPADSRGDRILSLTAHSRSDGTAPTLSGCGTSPTVTGSDVAGVVVTGSAATTCTITFARTYTTAPSCYFLPTGTATQPVYTVSATAIAVTTDIASTTYNYGCIGQ